MKLNEWLDAKDVSEADFASRIGVSAVSVFRYCKGQRRPEWNVMAKIYEETGGQVTPLDFFQERDFDGSKEFAKEEVA